MASVKVSERVDASASSVWDLLGDFGGVKRYSRGIERCTVRGEGVGAVRTLVLRGGLELQERLEAFDEPGRRLQYSIIAGPLPFTDYLATIEIREDGEACVVDWSSTWEPVGVSEAQARELTEGIYRGSVADVRKALGL